VPPQVDFAELEGTFETLVTSGPNGQPRTPRTKSSRRRSTARWGAPFPALPHNYKVVVLLADLEGYAYKEIADIWRSRSAL